MAGTPASSVRGGFPLGLAGAVSPTRYVGGTATVAPTTGTFAVGDFVITQTGKMYACTVAGTPGTWVQVGSSGGSTELDYAEVTANLTVTATTEGTAQAFVTGAAVVYDGATRICIEAFTAAMEASTGIGMYLVLYDGAGSIGGIAVVSATGTNDSPVLVRRYLTPSAASHTYSIRSYKTGGTATVFAGAGGSGNYMPGYIRITTA